MKVSFGPALGCGSAGLDEYVDLWLTDFLEPEEVLARVQASAVEDLMPLAASYVGERVPSLAVFINVFRYEVELVRGSDIGGDGSEDGNVAGFDIGHDGGDDMQASAALDEVLSRGTIEVVRRKGTRCIVLDEMLVERPELVSGTTEHGTSEKLTLLVRNSTTGTMRPEILIRAMNDHLAVPFLSESIVRTDEYHLEDGCFSKPL